MIVVFGLPSVIVAAALGIGAARNQDVGATKPAAQGSLLEAKKAESGGAVGATVDLKGNTLTAAMGDTRWGWAFEGFELDGTKSLRITLDEFTVKADQTTFCGFVIDYKTAKGYSQRVVLSLAGTNHPADNFQQFIPWGKGPRPVDVMAKITPEKNLSIDLTRWAPKGWTGDAWFTVGLYVATAPHQRMKMTLDLPPEQEKK